MSCNQIICDKGIYDKSSHKKALLAIKKAEGAGFEQNQEYKELTNCLSEINKYKTKKECSNGDNHDDDENDIRDHFDAFMKRDKERDELLKKVDPKLYKKKIDIDKKLKKYDNKDKVKYTFDKDYEKVLKDLKKALILKKSEDKKSYLELEKKMTSNKYEHSSRRNVAYKEEYNKLDDELTAIKQEIRKVLEKFRAKHGGTRKNKKSGNGTKKRK